MSPEKQRIVIAQEYGWILHKNHIGLQLPLILQCWTNGKVEIFGNYLPDYLNDLNAMNEAEALFDAPSKTHFGNNSAYYHYLSIVTKRDGNELLNRYRMIRATAAQRAEAFLRTIGKWEDE